MPESWLLAMPERNPPSGWLAAPGPGTLTVVAAPSIRAAVPDDAEEVERLRVAGWQAAYRGILPG